MTEKTHNIFDAILMELIFTNEVADVAEKCPPESYFRVFVARFEQLLVERVKKYLGSRNGVIDLILVSDEAIQGLNKEFRDKDKSTDVLSFAYLEGDEDIEIDSVTVGDIFISVDTAERQAKEKGHSLEKELGILFVHGLLHLFGFDHQNDEEEEEMERWAGLIINDQ